MRRLIFLLLILTNSLFAQKKAKDTYTIYVNYPDYTIKANVFNEPKKLVAKDTLNYFWYSSNKILQTQAGFDGKLLHGSYTSFYLSNNLKEKGGFKNGLKDGVWYSWFENGKVKETISWKKGVRSGAYKKFDEKGNQLLAQSYKNGKLTGNSIEYADNKVVSTKKYKKGIEVIVKPKKKKSVETPETKADIKEKKSFKDKLKSVFKKKEETDSTSKETAPASEEKKSEKKKKTKKAKADKNEGK